MRIKVLFLNFYGTLVYEDEEIIKRICMRIKKDSSYKFEIVDILSF